MNIGTGIATRSHSSLSRSHPVVSVVDGESDVRESLQEIIEGAGWRAQVFASATEFLTQARSDSPNCLVLDLQLPDSCGLDLQARMMDRPETPIIFITRCEDVPMTVRAMKAGALEFLAKPLQADLVLSAMSYAITLSARILRRESEVSLLRNRYASLTAREREVLGLVTQGYMNKHVSGELGISEVTVKAHRGRMMRKMAAGSLPHLVNMASHLALNPPPATSYARVNPLSS